MRSLSCIAIVSLLVASTALPAQAQDAPVTFNFGAGPIFPLGEVADRFDTGFTIPVGVTFNINENLGIQGEYSYSRMTGPDGTVTQSDGTQMLLESNHQMHTFLGNLVFRTGATGPVSGYVIGGLGGYYRQVQLTTPAVGLVTVCDPYWFVCYPVAVSVDNVIGTRSTTDFGINVGGGVTFGQHFYAEIRYHYVWGPEFEVPAALGGGTVKANGQYLPIIFGVKF